MNNFKTALLLLFISISLFSSTLFEVKDNNNFPVFSISDDGIRVFNLGDTVMVISASEIRANLNNSNDRGLSRSFSVSTNTTSKAGSNVMEVTATNATMHSLEVTGDNATMSSTAKGPRFSYFGADNLFLGENAGQLTTGLSNVFVGNDAGLANTSGGANVFIGLNAGLSNTIEHWNTYVGYGSGKFASGGSNAFFGYASGYNTTGDNNSFFGFNAASSNGSGENNSVFGYKAGVNNAGGSSNCVFGYNAGLGSSGNSDYNNNCLFGSYAGKELQTGDGNVMIGHYSGELAVSSSYNVFLGYQSAYQHNSGSANVFLGRSAGYNNQTGSGNVFIGNNAGYNETGSSRFHLANGSAAEPLLFGTFDSPRMLVIDGLEADNPNNRKLFVNGSAGGLSPWYNDSDKRKKKNIKTIEASLDKVSKLRGVTYEWNAGDKYESGTQMGFIAQEAEKVIPEVVNYNLENDSYGMQYAPITALLIEAVKELKKENELLKSEIQEIKKQLSK